ncbi:MAG TPA: hypothetical protein VG324_27730 [Blastocatellia bacterium]|nr:hypothetical protein [Blastocatellia bacterium]
MNQQDPIAAEAVNELTSVVTEMSVTEMSVTEVAEQEPMDGAVESEPITAETEADPAP